MTDTVPRVDNLHPEPLTISARRLENKVILITRASAGIGEAAARRFSAEGATVVGGARRTDRLDALVADVEADGGDALALALDVTDGRLASTALTSTQTSCGPGWARRCRPH